MDSTNEYLKRQGDMLPDRTIVTAGHQTAGKGRQGKTWQEEEGQSLLCSWLFKELRQEQLLLLPIAAGLAVKLTLMDLGLEGAMLKWPNDVVAQSDGKIVKLAGILCESRTMAGGRLAVCGIGLNLCQKREDFARCQLYDAGSVKSIWEKKVNREQLLKLLSENLYRLVDTVGQNPQQLLAEYSKGCITLGRQVKIKSADGQISAFAQGIAPDGALICQTADGEIRVHAGEVSLRGCSGYAE